MSLKLPLALSLLIILISGCSMHHRKSEDAVKPVDLTSLKSLEGKWETDSGQGGKKETVVYKVTSGGKAVEETIFPGTPHEMVSVYYETDNTVGMTHYCMLGNRPQFRAEQVGPNQVLFRYVDSPGINPKTDSLMNQVAMKIVDPNHLEIKWSGVTEGKPGEDKEAHFHRVG